MLKEGKSELTLKGHGINQEKGVKKGMQGRRDRTERPWNFTQGNSYKKQRG